MSCSQLDAYYTTGTVPPGDSCGLCDGEYSYCYPSVSGQPSCCPKGTTYSGKRMECGSCSTRGVPSGTKYLCLPDQPQMDQTARVNCCLDQNLPNNSPNGYCASGWCPNSTNCQSFMTSYCTGDNLKTNECLQFCRSNIGKCDPSLTSYCSNPDNFGLGICGCALPLDQYLFSKLRTPDGMTIPISCDRRCDVNNDAIRLQGQQDCKIGTICVVDIEDADKIANEVKGGIIIDQNCGNSPAPPPPIPAGDGFFKKYWYIFLIIGIIIVIIILFAVLYKPAKKVP